MITPIIRRLHPGLDARQLEVIAHGDGPLQVVAGPGSGKTTCIALRAANLVLTGRVQPHELVLCTFTQEAAREMRTRFTNTLNAAGYTGDLSRVAICTIHSLCRRLLTQYGNVIGLPLGYRLLNATDQLDLMETNYDPIFGPDHAVLAHGNDSWNNPRQASDEARRYFDRISDDLIDPNRLIASERPFLAALGRSCLRYGKLLWEQGAVDFAHLQDWALALLEDPDVLITISAGVRHLLVDEYQDTSFAQEQLLLRLASTHGNVCVVGDEDQSIYRFRGARVDNMLRFGTRLRGCSVLFLTNNYRSHGGVVAAFNRWISAGDWSNPGGVDYRFPKTIVPSAAHANDDYPAVVSIIGTDKLDELRHLAELLSALRARDFITDYRQAAILLPSVKRRYSKPYLDALRATGIPVHLAPGRHELEDDDIVPRKPQPPKDHVLLTTIHQAKGREWPVVAVALPSGFRQWPDRLNRDLGRFRPQPDGEPADRVDEFDLRRRYFVAFFRAKRLLALTGTGPDPAFEPVLSGARIWPDVDLERLHGNGGLVQTAPADRTFPTVMHHVGPISVRVHRGRPSIILAGRLQPDRRARSG